MIFVFVWVIWLSIISSWIIYVVTDERISFFFKRLNNILLCIHQQTLWSFPFLAVETNATINIGVQTSCQYTDFISFGFIPRNEIAGSHGSSNFNFFEETSILFSIRVASIYIPTNTVQSVQFSCSVVSDSATPWTAACQASLSITNFWSLLKLISIESLMLSNHLILCCPLLLLPSIFPSIRVFSNESALHIRWPKYWSFSFNISPSNEYSGLISFRMDWLYLLAVQGTLKSLLQHHSSKASILQHSAFLMVQFSHPYMTTGKP